MRNTETKWRIWALIGCLVPIAAAVFLIVTVINNLPDNPSPSDARNEANAVLSDIRSGNMGALSSRFTTNYPPGPKEMMKQCRGAASGGQISVRTNADFPNAFRITVKPPEGKQRGATCSFALIQKDHRWTINYPVSGS